MSMALGAKHKDASVKKMSTSKKVASATSVPPYDIAMSHSRKWSRTIAAWDETVQGYVPQMQFKTESFHPQYQEEEKPNDIVLREMTKEMLEELKKRVPVNTGFLIDALTRGKATINLTGHNHSYQAHSRHDDKKTKWQPNKYSADKRKRIRRQAVENYKLGANLSDLARLYGVRRQTIKNWVNLAIQGLL
jgi:hypothetical protein